MHLELSVALNFIISYLYNKLPRRRVDMFCEELEKGLRKKFEGHWYPEEPFKGSGFRSIKLSNDKVDPVLDMAAQLSGLSIGEILEYLPKALTLWIDPNEVSYRIGENSSVKILYCNRRGATEELIPENSGDHELQPSGQGFNPRAEGFQITDQQLPASLSGLNLSPSSNGGWVAGSNGSSSPSSGASNSTSPVGTFRPRPTASTCFTAATFAQTKFGSTKMKTQAQRPTRLSPTELGGGFASMGSKHSPISPLGPPSLWANLSPCLQNPTSSINLIQLSPMQSFPQFIGLRDSRMEILKEQQHCLLLLQQQQQQQLKQQQQQNGRMHGSMSQGGPNVLSSNADTLSSSGRADDDITKSMTNPLQAYFDHQSTQPSFHHSSSASGNIRNLSPCPTSVPAVTNCTLPNQSLQPKSPQDVHLKPRDDSRSFLHDNQMTTPEDFDWSSLINSYANVSHLLVAN